MADSHHDFVTQVLTGGAAVLATIGGMVGGAKVGHRRGSAERRENDSAVQKDIKLIKASLGKLDEKQDRQASETHKRIDEILLILGGRK